MNNVFINNINDYLRQRKIKHNYIALMTGWDKSKINRLLSGKADLKWNDMEILAKALGHDIIYFMEDKFKMENNENRSGQIAFFAENLQDDDKKTADKLVEMFRFYDALTSIDFSNSLDMIFGIETIYCVKDIDIIENIN